MIMTFLANFILKDAKSVANKIDFGEIKGSTMLVTGASGLIGHYLVASINAAAKKGNAPAKLYLVVKNELPPYFKEILGTIPHEILRGDITNNEFVKSLPKAKYIIHAAGYGQPSKFMIDPISTLKLNTLTTFATIDKLESGGKYLFISTSEVYSGLPKPPYKENQIGTTNTDHPRFCYIEGKRCGEAIINAYRTKGVLAKSARLSLAYGPGIRKNDTRALNNFIQKALTTGKIELMDSGTSPRTYLYVTDAVEILFNILFRGKEGLYNVGGNSRTTIAGLAKLIGKNIKVPVILSKKETGISGAPSDVSLDMTKATKEFGVKKFVSLEEGLERTIDWQSKLY